MIAAPSLGSVPAEAASTGSAKALDAATVAFRHNALGAHATLLPASRCWYATDANAGPAGMLCGPVSYAGDPIDAHWQAASTAATGRPTLGAHGQRLSARETLADAAGHPAPITSPRTTAASWARGTPSRPSSRTQGSR